MAALLTTRYVLPVSNFALKATNLSVKLINGDATYTGSPPKVEDPLYPMTNLLNGDRSSFWSTGPSPPSTVAIELDLGANRSINVIGLHGIRNGTLPSQVDIGYRVSSSGYGTTWTPLPSIGMSNLRDAGTVQVSPISARYWRLAFSTFSQSFSVAMPVLGTSLGDLGVTYSPNADYGLTFARIRELSAARVPVLTTVGDDSYENSLPFRSVKDSVKDQLLVVAGADLPVTLIDVFGVFQQIMLSSEKITTRHVWNDGTTNYWDIDLPFTRLG